MCRQIQQSSLINSSFECIYVNLSTSRGNDEVNKFSTVLLFRKGLRFISSFLKDTPFVLLCKLFRCNIILHQHNKGMAAYVDKPVYRWLLPLVYRKTNIILLSWLLYDDIAAVVKREQVKICPNGIS